MTLWLVYSCIVTPYSIAFLNPEPLDTLFTIDMIIDLSFLFDVFMNFFTAYYDKEAVLHYKLWDIAKNYATSWLLLDLLAGFPSEVFTIALDRQRSNPGKNYSSLAQLTKFRNATKLLKIGRSMKFYRYTGKSSLARLFQNFLSLTHNSTRFIKAIISILLSLHIMSCFYYFSSKFEDFSPDT